MSEPLSPLVRRAPPWSNDGLAPQCVGVLHAFMNDMKLSFGEQVNGVGAPPEPLFTGDGLRSGFLLQTPRDLIARHRDLLSFAMIDTYTAMVEGVDVAERLPHYNLGVRTVLDRGAYADPYRHHAWIAERRERWMQCPLLSRGDDALAPRWRAAVVAVGIEAHRLSRRISIGMQAHLVGPEAGDAAWVHGTRYVLVCAAWALAASWWQCGTRVWVALLNTSFSRLAIVDEGGSHVLVVEQAGLQGSSSDKETETEQERGHEYGHEYEANMSQLAETHNLAHDFLPQGDIDRTAFDLYWDVFVRGYDVALRWVDEEHRVVERFETEIEMDGRDDDERGDRDGDSDMENGVDDNGYDDGDDDDDDDSDDSDADSNASTPSSTLSDYRFDSDETDYDDTARLITSLARMFPRYRVVSPSRMTSLIEGELLLSQHQCARGPLDDVALPSI